MLKKKLICMQMDDLEVGSTDICYCERSELSGLFNARIFYIYPVRRAVNVLNVSTCI